MAWIAAAASVAGGLMASSAAGDASDAQIASGRESNALQRETRDLIRSDNAPFMARGNAAGIKLADLLGLDVGSSAQFGGTGSLTPAQLRAELISQYTTGAGPGGWVGGGDDGASQWIDQPGRVDEAGLNAAIQQRMQQAQAQSAPAQRSAQFGSLLKPFTGADLVNDPGYKFGLDQGVQANSRAMNAGNGTYSGATMKALARFGTDYGGTKFNEAFNRDQTQKGQTYNMLSGTAGTGQTAVSQVSSANQNYGNNVGSTLTDMGNARASGYVGSANGWNNAIGQGIGNYQQQQLLNKLPSRNLLGGSSSGSGSLFNGWAGSEPYSGYNSSIGV